MNLSDTSASRFRELTVRVFITVPSCGIIRCEMQSLWRSFSVHSILSFQSSIFCELACRMYSDDLRDAPADEVPDAYQRLEGVQVVLQR